MNDESNEQQGSLFDPCKICTCSESSSLRKQEENAVNKRHVIEIDLRTEAYIKEHRVQELMQYLFLKLLSKLPENPVTYLEKLFDDCMLYRAGHGIAPVIYNNRHLTAVIKSFDPSQRGWLSGDQIKQIFLTLGLSLNYIEGNEIMSTDDVLQLLQNCQHEELSKLLSAGIV